ncbi:hypothetical protein [Oscillatoria sp. CS-180]|uniref:hypothetical protein n=1 Tax=Oscillatoria sp. CS-180 TaxID=3021720 RepID=UPI002FEE05A0
MNNQSRESLERLYKLRVFTNMAVAIPGVTVLRLIYIEDGYNIRTVQELLGHKDVKTLMIDTYVLSQGGEGCEVRWMAEGK